LIAGNGSEEDLLFLEQEEEDEEEECFEVEDDFGKTFLKTSPK